MCGAAHPQSLSLSFEISYFVAFRRTCRRIALGKMFATVSDLSLVAAAGFSFHKITSRNTCPHVCICCGLWGSVRGEGMHALATTKTLRRTVPLALSGSILHFSALPGLRRPSRRSFRSGCPRARFRWWPEERRRRSPCASSARR